MLTSKLSSSYWYSVIVFQAHGVNYLFTLVGGHISPILVAAEALGIQVVDTRHEVTAVFAADAVARMSGVVGVAAVTAGPGTTETSSILLSLEILSKGI